MFAYCINNPVNCIDNVGLAASIALEWDGFPTVECNTSGCGGDVIATIIALILGLFSGDNDTNSNPQDTTGTMAIPHSSKIDWGGDKGHILNGSKNHDSHKPGWQKFGIDPGGNGAWPVILKLLQEVVDNSDKIQKKQLPNGDWLAYYYKTYAEKGIEIVVKIWEKADGTIEKLSDAWAQIIGE